MENYVKINNIIGFEIHLKKLRTFVLTQKHPHSWNTGVTHNKNLKKV